MSKEELSKEQVSKAKKQRLWMRELSAAKAEIKPLHERGRKICDVYLDVRGATDKSEHKFNYMNTNVNNKRDLLCSRLPSPAMSTTNLDADDSIARMARTLLQRVVNAELKEQANFQDNLKNAIKDRLLPGFSCLWNRYVPTYSGEQASALSENVEDETAELAGASPKLLDERTPIDYVYWEDILWSPARNWGEVRWVARRAYLTKEEFEERFPDAQEAEEFAREMEGGHPKSDDPNGPQNIVQSEVPVWEIWDKTSLKVYFIREGALECLEEQDDPYGLPNFFPCPKFLMADHGTNNFMPVADYVLVQDQYEELNRVTARISALVDQCKARGIYDEDIEELSQLLNPDTPEGMMFPASKYGDMQAKGGLKGCAEFVDILPFVQAINLLRTEQASLIKHIQLLTGDSDIAAGASSPYETKGAQEIKAEFQGQRIQATQQEVAEFVEEAIQNQAFLITKFYEPERIISRAGRIKPDQQQFVQPAVQLLKDQKLREIVITVTVDSLQRQNWARDKQQRTEATGMLAQMVMQAPPDVQQVFLPTLLEVIDWNFQAFPGTEGIQETVHQAIAKVIEQRDQQAPDAKQKAEQQAKQEAEMKAQQAAQAKQQELAATTEVEKGKAQTQLRIKQMEIAAQEQIKAREAALKAAELKLKEIELNHAGIDTEEATLALGDANPSMRMNKDEIAQALMQQQAAVAEQTNAMFQQMMQLMQAQMQQYQAGQAQIAALLNEPMPPAEIVIRNPDGSVKLSGSIE